MWLLSTPRKGFSRQYRKSRKSGPRRLYNLVKVTQLVNDDTDIQTQVWVTSSNCSILEKATLLPVTGPSGKVRHVRAGVRTQALQTDREGDFPLLCLYWAGRLDNDRENDPAHTLKSQFAWTRTKHLPPHNYKPQEEAYLFDTQASRRMDGKAGWPSGIAVLRRTRPRAGCVSEADQLCNHWDIWADLPVPLGAGSGHGGVKPHVCSERGRERRETRRSCNWSWHN